MSDFCQCKTLREATKPGTDNEGYGALVSLFPVKRPDDQITNTPGWWKMGYDLPDVRFCPWCGKRLPTLHEYLFS